MRITFVKKILTDRLESENLFEHINHIAIADERDPDSEGARLARKYAVSRAPFFIVEDDGGEATVFDVYFKFKAFLKAQGVEIQATPSL